MDYYPRNPVSPGTSLIRLILLAVGCTFVLQMLFLLVYLLLTGDYQALSGVSGDPDVHSPEPAVFLNYLLLAGSSIGAFLLPVIVLQRMESHSQYLPMSQTAPAILFVLAMLFLISFNPIMELISDWNRQLTLPEALAGIERWMYQKEDEMAALTEKIVMTADIRMLLINLFVIAVLPAIGEEFFFRGALQGILARWINNRHLVIWLTAIIFSIIHIQFLGFFPRMLLGAIFGYMLLLTNNIWVPIFAHFMNNAAVVLTAFYYTTQHKSYQELMFEGNTYHFSLYFVSVVVSVVLGWYFYNLSAKQKGSHGTGLDKN